MRSIALASSFVLIAGCGGGNLEVAPDDETGVEAGSDGSGAEVATDGGVDGNVDGGADGNVDGGGVDAPPPTCVPPTADSTDLYVDAAVGTTGKGAAGCPFKTIVEASSFALTGGVKRTIHVKTGSYDEKDAIRLEPGVTLVSEGGPSKLAGGSTAPCAPSPEKCLLAMKGGSTVDGFNMDAKSVGIGIFGSGGPPVVRKTAVKSAQRDGGVFLNGADLAEVHFDANGNAGVLVRAGKLRVLGTANTFDANKGKGTWVSGSYIAAGGIVLYGAELEFEGGSASNNQSGGVAWDWGTPGPSSVQKITGLVAKGNAGGGLTLQPQSSLTLRKSTLTKNADYGLWLTYNSSLSNVFDLGTAGSPGGNVFGGGSDKNGKVGMFLCRSGKTGTQVAEGDAFATCAPSQGQAPNCDSFPASYADVGYVPAGSVGTTSGANPLAVPAACTVGP